LTFFRTFPWHLQLLKDPTSSASSKDCSTFPIVEDYSAIMGYFTTSIASFTGFIASI
jgi:hypothetical protein